MNAMVLFEQQPVGADKGSRGFDEPLIEDLSGLFFGLQALDGDFRFEF